MQSSSFAEDVTNIPSVDLTLVGLYRQVKSEYRSMRRRDHSLFNVRLWGSMAPSGNIYRLNALIAERLKHSDDLWHQVREVAQETFEMEGMPTRRPEQTDSEFADACADAMYMELKKTKVQNYPTLDAESNEDLLGFKPMEEFLATKVDHNGPSFFFGSLLLHVDEDERSAYKKNLLVSCVIWLIQIAAPLLIFINQWTSQTNYLLDGYFFQKFEPRELVCFADNLTEGLTMVMGVLFLILVSIVIRSYVDTEIDNLEKQSKLCLSRWWTGAGVFANAYCCLMTMIILPLLFWSELRPTDIVLDALGLLFIFTLDDLAGDVLGYLEIDDSDFQRMAVWHTAILSQCPVHVRDVMNLNADRLQDLWQIRYNASGQLLEFEGGKRCSTRLEYLEDAKEASETTQLNPENKLFMYHRDRLVRRVFGHVNYIEVWIAVRYLLIALQIFVPPAWLILSQPCYPHQHH